MPFNGQIGKELRDLVQWTLRFSLFPKSLSAGSCIFSLPSCWWYPEVNNF